MEGRSEYCRPAQVEIDCGRAGQPCRRHPPTRDVGEGEGEGKGEGWEELSLRRQTVEASGSGRGSCLLRCLRAAPLFDAEAFLRGALAPELAGGGRLLDYDLRLVRARPGCAIMN